MRLLPYTPCHAPHALVSSMQWPRGPLWPIWAEALGVRAVTAWELREQHGNKTVRVHSAWAGQGSGRGWAGQWEGLGRAVGGAGQGRAV